MFYVADIDNNGRAELIAVNEQRWERYSRFILNEWCLQPFSATPGNPSMLGSYPLGIGDRFFFGHPAQNSSGTFGNVVLAVNPLPQLNGSRGPAVMQTLTPTGWIPVGNPALNAPGYLGCWKLYQDLPAP